MYKNIKSVEIRSIGNYTMHEDKLKHVLLNEESATHVLHSVTIKANISTAHGSNSIDVVDVTVINKLSQTQHTLTEVHVDGTRK